MHALLHMYTHIHMFVQTYIKIRARSVGVCFDKALHFQAGNTNPESLCAAVKPGKSQQSAISDITSGGEAHITDETTEIMQLGICSSMLSEVLSRRRGWRESCVVPPKIQSKTLRTKRDPVKAAKVGGSSR